MNKHIVKANELWRENDVEHALMSYQRAVHCPHAQILEKQISHYMIAYLNCVLARRSSQEEIFLGVDLRRPYHDYYLKAAEHLMMLNNEQCFEADALGLPQISLQQYAYIDEAYGYYSELCDVYIESWYIRLKTYFNHYMSGAWHRIQRLAHV